jgi:hypothetical protein
LPIFDFKSLVRMVDSNCASVTEERDWLVADLLLELPDAPAAEAGVTAIARNESRNNAKN